MLKRIWTVFLLCVLTVPVLYAQSTMSDEQVVEFVIKENEAGTSQEQIYAKLLKKGVTPDQIKRIRSKYDKQKNGDVIGSRDIVGESGDKRLRKKNTTQKGRKDGDGRGDRRLKNDDDYDDYLRLKTDKERREWRERHKDEYAEGLDFLLPDSMLLFEEAMYRKRQTKQIFGRNIFNRKDLSFEPSMNIATPKNYRLGPGDEVFVDIWGASQKTIECTVSPEGVITIEGYGPVQVSGLTVDQVNETLKSTLGQRYNNSEVRLSLGQTRTITVHVVGEVEVPGTYTLSAFATVFHALYMAGGTNELGTLRDIKVYRNNRLVSTVDVYDYILNGQLSCNIRLEDDDMIVVAPYLALVDITGKIRRPMFYEMKPSESLGTLIRYAGGFTGDAYRGNLRLTRKSNGRMEVFTVGEFEMKDFRLADGDSVAVDSVLDRYRNMVEVKGAVFRPGKYQIDGNIRSVRKLVEAADGLTEDAFTARAIIHRRKVDRTLEAIAVDIDKVMKGEVSDIVLQNEDLLYIPSLKDAHEEKTLTIVGEVLYPGVYQYAEHTTLEDFVLQAGGLNDAASVVKVDVARRIRQNNALKSGNEIAQTFSFALKKGFIVDGEAGFELEPFDEVYVRRSPGYIEQEHVTIEGEVQFAGRYVIAQKGMRLSDLVKMSGGLTHEAYAKGARLERKLTSVEKKKQEATLRLLANGDSVPQYMIDNLPDVQAVGIDLDKALDKPGSNEWDIVLREGDKLVIPQYNNTVTISGAVNYTNTVAYKEGEGLDYYINQAGGYAPLAKKSRVFAVHMNGNVTRVKRAKHLQPGCEIVVPSREKRKGMSTGEILGISSSATSLAAIIATLFIK